MPVFAQPFDGAQETVLQGDARLPTQQRFRLGVVGEKALDLARGGADALAVGFDPRVRADGLDQELREIADRDLAVRAEVECLADRRVVRDRKSVV